VDKILLKIARKVEWHFGEELDGGWK